MKNRKKSSLLSLLIVIVLIFLYNTVLSPDKADEDISAADHPAQYDELVQLSDELDEDEYYYSADEVGAYIHAFGHLPHNFISKREADALGWNGGSLDKIKEGFRIGGDYFGNYEGKLPKGKNYTECDVNCPKNSRGEERIIFSDDGWIYYTPDHYETFETLYSGK